MLTHFASRMANPLRRLRLDNSDVLPLCYELALGQQRVLSTSTAAQPSESKSKSKSQNIEENPYFSKYADKIKKAQVEKAKPTATFSEAMKTNVKTETVVEQTNDNLICQEMVASIEPKPKETYFNTETTKQDDKSISALKKSKRSLDSVVKVDMLSEKTPEEITQIWNAYHSKRDGVYATISADIYDTLYKNSVIYPAFILPLPRNKEQSSEGYEFFLLQFQEHSCYFTPLAAYHLHKDIAPICLTLNHFPELSQSKGLVLMNSEYDSNILNIMECQCLANQLQYYYTTQEAAPKLSLHLFNKEPKSFDHMRLIRHLEDGMLSSGLGAINLDKQD